MGTTKPPSPTTNAISAAGSELASLSLVKGLLRIAPGLPVAALAGVVILFFAWSCEHQARQREAEEAKQVKKEAAAQISQLQQQAASAVRDAQQSAQAAKQLEGQRQQLANEADGLRQSLDSLHQQQLARDNELASLTTEEVVKRVAARLQEQGIGNREQGTVQQADPPTAVGAAKNNGSQTRGQDARATAGGTPAPQSAAGGTAAPQAALVLSDQGVRKVEGAFEDLDSCRQQSQVMSQQVTNCEQRAKLDLTLQQQQAATITKLNAALADKDQILARSEAAHRAELKAARGSWRARLYHAAGIFAG